MEHAAIKFWGNISNHSSSTVFRKEVKKNKIWFSFLWVPENNITHPSIPCFQCFFCVLKSQLNESMQLDILRVCCRDMEREPIAITSKCSLNFCLCTNPAGGPQGVSAPWCGATGKSVVADCRFPRADGNHLWPPMCISAGATVTVSSYLYLRYLLQSSSHVM